MQHFVRVDYCPGVYQWLTQRPRMALYVKLTSCAYDLNLFCSGGFRLGLGGGHRPPNLAQASQIFNWFYNNSLAVVASQV